MAWIGPFDPARSFLTSPAGGYMHISNLSLILGKAFVSSPSFKLLVPVTQGYSF